jgi:hypothetical protein
VASLEAAQSPVVPLQPGLEVSSGSQTSSDATVAVLLPCAPGLRASVAPAPQEAVQPECLIALRGLSVPVRQDVHPETDIRLFPCPGQDPRW